MGTIKEYISAYKQRNQIEREAIIKSGFSVVERGGMIWLTHHGVAFMKVASLATAEDVAKELNKARQTAVEFERI